MGTLAQIGTNGTDTLNAQPLGEGFERLTTSAGNNVVFRSPAEKTTWMLSDAGRTALYTSHVGMQDLGTDGTYNDFYQTPQTF